MSAAAVIAVLGHEGSGKSALVAAVGPRPGLLLLEGRDALGVADGVVFVLSSAQGLDPTLPLRWDEAAEAGLPRVLAVTQLDLPRADFDESVAVAQRVLGEGVHPLLLPMLDDDERVAGLLDLLALQVHDSSSGDRVLRDPDPEHRGLVEHLHEELVEAVLSASADDAGFTSWLEGVVPPVPVLRRELCAGVAAGQLHPVLAVTPQGVGARELAELLEASVPSAVHGGPDDPLDVRESGPWRRVLSGTLDGAGPGEVLRG